MGRPGFEIDSAFGFGTAAAILDADGVLIAQSELFARHFSPAVIDVALVRKIARGSKGGLGFSNQAGSGYDRPSILAYDHVGNTRSWRTPADFPVPDEAGVGKVVVLGVVPPEKCSWIEMSCRFYGLTEMQTRVCLALLAHGDLRTAAARSGIAYGTAREALRAILRKLGVDSTPAMITYLTSHWLGADLTSDDSPYALSELFGLTPRQLAMVTLVADGLSRTEAAGIVGISMAVAKKEMDFAYASLGVGSATELARTVAEARAIALLTQATPQCFETETDQPSVEQAAEPLAFVEAPKGRRLAYSDYGPAGAPPVLVLHSAMTNRPVCTVLLDALHRCGFRVLALDRPGFGLTDPVKGARAGEHDPFANAARDTIWFCQKLGLPKVNIVANGAAPVVLALQGLCPDLLGRVVMINPHIGPEHDTHSSGLLAATKRAFRSQPWLAETAARLIYRFSSPALGRFGIWRSVRGSWPDEAVMAIERNLRDYLRSMRMFSQGKLAGFVNEQVGFVTLPASSPHSGTTRWSVLVGGCDFLFKPDEVNDFWTRTLPDANCRIVADAGRLLVFSHARMIAEILARD
jgi:pimeloyl-ACP methyl ester carboxylesterase/DNA-binding CsgD family transcriptional regulator